MSPSPSASSPRSNSNADSRPELALAIANGDLANMFAEDHYSPDKDTSYVVVCIILAVITSVVVFLRLYCSRFVSRRFGWDDGLTFAAWMTFVPYVCLIVWSLRQGSGRERELMELLQYPFDLPHLELYQKIDTVSSIIHSVALVLIRISGFVLFYRICAGHRQLRTVIWAFSAITILCWITQLLLIVLHCLPVTVLWFYEWQPGYAEHKCLAWRSVFMVISTISVACDILLFSIAACITALPDMPRWRKLQMLAVLIIGLIVTGLSGARLWLIYQSLYVTATINWYYGPLLLVRLAEMSATFIALCIPGLTTLCDAVSKWVSRKRFKPLDSRTSHGSRASCSLATFQHSDLQLRPPNEILCSRDAWVEGGAGTTTTTDASPKDIGGQEEAEGIMVQVDFHLNVNEEECESCQVHDFGGGSNPKTSAGEYSFWWAEPP